MSTEPFTVYFTEQLLVKITLVARGCNADISSDTSQQCQWVKRINLIFRGGQVRLVAFLHARIPFILKGCKFVRGKGEEAIGKSTMSPPCIGPTGCRLIYMNNAEVLSHLTLIYRHNAGGKLLRFAFAGAKPSDREHTCSCTPNVSRTAMRSRSIGERILARTK